MSKQQLVFYKVLLLIAAILTLCSASNPTTATVYYDDTTGYNISYGILDKANGAAYGTYDRTQNETGWAILNIAAGYSSRTVYKDDVLMRAAGILEGALTQPDIFATYQSQVEFWFSGAPSNLLDKAKAFYQNQRTWMEMMIEKNPSSLTWQYMNLIYQQFQGLMDGYRSAAPTSEAVDDFGFDFLSGNGDWLDIVNFIDEKGFFKKKMEYFPDGHCSVLFKVLPGYENIYASHSSWYIYSSMLRIYKHYSFNLSDKRAACKTMSFSSYPAYLSSLDDFYIMDSQLVMLQTTNPIDNYTIYSKATNRALLAWHRVRLANWLADNGKDWAEYIKEYNSGTYNNQYMVLDLKKVTLKQSINDSAFWVVEQIPGLVVAGDQTAILREGYWASYNVPFYEEISQQSGIPERVEKSGFQYSHDLAPRAKIFRRDQSKVHNMSTMQDIMRYNGYKLNDPYSGGSPNGAICAREDLATDNPRAGGCTDTKITDYFNAKSLTAIIKNGPTHTNGLPVFSWSNTTVSSPHYGQPDVFDFDWIQQSPRVP